MIEIKVKTIWQGQVGIRDKYVQEALKQKNGLIIRKENEIMIIPAEELEAKIKGVSEKPFKDRFSEKQHFLFYFDWKPMQVNKTLFE